MKTKKQDLLFEWNNKNLFGERLIFLRKRRALTQQELADILFVSKYTISSYEHGKTTPDDCSKIMLAKFFDVSLDYLFGLIDTAVSMNVLILVFIYQIILAIVSGIRYRNM